MIKNNFDSSAYSRFFLGATLAHNLDQIFSLLIVNNVSVQGVQVNKMPFFQKFTQKRFPYPLCPGFDLDRC